MSRRPIITATIAALLGAIISITYADDNDIEKATVNISVLDGGDNAIVYINNENVGFNPLRELELEQGYHEISIRPDSKYRPIDFNLAAGNGKKYNVHFGLTPKNKETSFNWRVFFITAGVTSVAFVLLFWIGVTNIEWR